MIKFLFGVLWGALAIFGIWSFVERGLKNESIMEWTYHGDRKLPKNYRFGDSDWPQIDGRADRNVYKGEYLRRPLAPQQKLTVADLSSSPEIEVSSGFRLVLLPLKSQAAAAAMNAGVTVSIWKEEQLISGVSVLALLCPGRGSPVTDCQAVLEVPAAAVLPTQDWSKLILLPTIPDQENSR